MASDGATALGHKSRWHVGWNWSEGSSVGGSICRVLQGIGADVAIYEGTQAVGRESRSIHAEIMVATREAATHCAVLHQWASCQLHGVFLERPSHRGNWRRSGSLRGIDGSG